VTFAIFKKISGVIPSGLLTSKTTSPVASSQKITETVISLGNIFVIVKRDSSSVRLILGSVLIINLFFNDLD